MPEELYGRWTLTITGRGDRVKVVLAGTKDADGEYQAASQPYEVIVDGDRWTVSGERLAFGTAAWTPFTPLRSSTWDLQLGLVRQLRWSYRHVMQAEPGATSLVSRHDVFLTCRSHDPLLAAVPTPAPPDFTLPDF